MERQRETWNCTGEDAGLWCGLTLLDSLGCLDNGSCLRSLLVAACTRALKPISDPPSWISIISKFREIQEQKDLGLRGPGFACSLFSLWLRAGVWLWASEEIEGLGLGTEPTTEILGLACLPTRYTSC